uniref:Uncharacterized protein n=1 Tax=Anguilla anguilla TaxID=7936 RepID=A0A0E9TBB4_ANGAN
MSLTQAYRERSFPKFLWNLGY